ncbi:MAG TPA: phosphoribosylamine--glycine ligase [Sediminispirochaeta sp.]|nr:phosphoribosylamine--glycine ligase [Sediminispirochaeta sp.]
MKVLILGSGAKDHALAWAISKSHIINGLYVAPGNSGTGEIAENITDTDITDPEQVAALCRRLEVDYCFVGDSQSISNGVVDFLNAEGISVFGAPKAAGRLETERLFAREFIKKYSIPSTRAEIFHDFDAFAEYVESHPGRLVLKRNKATNGKNVFDSRNKERLLQLGREILQQDTLLVERFEEGINLSVFALLDEKNHLILPPVSDYHKAQDNDTGMGTSGMGAICPVPILSDKIHAHILTDIIEPTIEGLRAEGLCYKGVFFFSLLIQERTAKVTSFHLRFGDPEAQVLIPLIESDLGELAKAIDRQQLDKFNLKLSHHSAVGVVVAADGYPQQTPKKQVVSIDPFFPNKESILFHGATQKNGDGKIYTTGGRCFTVVGLGENILKANSKAYQHIGAVRFPGAWNRNDIGNRFFEDI